MGKKIDEPEIKKECPSCGLGVAMDSTICEFCGWDFDEEDEWILQIEKLERDLMLEKQKSEPGSVNERIESSLHSPAAVKAEMIKMSSKPVGKQVPAESARPIVPSAKPQPEVKVQASAPVPAVQPIRSAEPTVRAQPAPEVRTEPAPAPAPQPILAPETSSNQPVPGTKVRRVRTVKAAHASGEEGVSDSSRKLVRVVKTKKGRQ